ncbi:hypothetical protein [Melghirimyces algeriensis]|uniref:Uncharacterized protein n=1 Tax=Melghirimyces algeriensis TaxID=910412 RepID=A0A521EYM8_9BACL|nr:hypothetical protein [Melghirimyces algeriensis]SMO88561.1 hypothetical protein SAMN06264849_11151 [Melghirimyces algeriensis]
MVLSFGRKVTVLLILVLLILGMFPSKASGEKVEDWNWSILFTEKNRSERGNL